jgi:hypothetical protein
MRRTGLEPLRPAALFVDHPFAALNGLVGSDHKTWGWNSFSQPGYPADFMFYSLKGGAVDFEVYYHII